MNVQTTRFGQVEVEEDRLLEFPFGMLGFSSYRSFALLQPDDQAIFYWLQSIESPELAFVVTDPAMWVPDYQAQIRRDQMEELGLADVTDAQVLVVVNKREGILTGNMQGPLVINPETRQGVQLVLADKRWDTRHELMELTAKDAVTA